MKGMAMRRVLRRLDCIRTPQSNFKALESDKEDVSAPLSTPLLAKRMRRSSCGDGSPSPSVLAKRKHEQASDNGNSDSPLTDPSNRKVLGCVSRSKRRKRLVTLEVGKERQVFKVEPQMLEHRLLKCLLARTTSTSTSTSSSQDKLWEEKENVVVPSRSRKGPAAAERPVRVDCDVILFEHILWLLNNDDPAIRQLNIEELMEFYDW